MAYTFFFSALAVFALSIITVSKKIAKCSLEFDLHFIKLTLKEALPFAMMNIFIVVYFRIDTVMIAILRNDLELGWYSAAYRLLEGMILIPNMIMAPIYPVFSRLFISSIDSLMLLYKYVLKIMTIISLPITIVAMFLSEEIIRTFYGTAFANSTYALLILIWAIPFILSYVRLWSTTARN